MTRHDVQFHRPGRNGSPAQLLVDGRDLSGVAGSVTVDSIANRGTRVVVSFPAITHIAISESSAAVEVDEETRGALLVLGWTPPAG